MDSYLMGIIAPEERGLASAINSIIWRLPNSVTTIAGGLILGAGLYSLPFLLATGFYATAIFLFYMVFKKVSPTVETVVEASREVQSVEAKLTSAT